MNNRKSHVGRRQLYTQTLLRDPRWRGPFLAVALMFGIQTRPDGEGRRFQVDRNAAALGVARRGVHQIIHALIEQGYMIRTAEDGDAAYQLTAIRPAIELDEQMSGTYRMSTWDDPGPATAWLADETKAWTQFQISREQVWRAQAADNPEQWSDDTDTRPAPVAEDAA